MKKNKSCAVYYEVIKDKINHPEIGKYTAYGIRAIERDTGRELERIPDVSTSRTEVARLVDSYNVGGLHPIHLFDVIDDFLAE